jgi:hypothetical protein
MLYTTTTLVMEDDDIIMGYLEESNQASAAALIDPLHRAAKLSQTLKNHTSSPLSQSAARLLVLSLRQINRLLHERVVEQRRSLSALRREVDELNASLNSCQFEKQHLFAQAQKCLTVKYTCKAYVCSFY